MFIVSSASDSVLDAANFPSSFAYSDGAQWTSMTAAEVKSLLGVATGKYKLRFQVTTDDLGSVSLAKSVPVVNTASFTTTFTKTATGTYTITIPVSGTYKRLVNFFFETNIGADYVLRWYTAASELVTVYLYKNGVLSDPALDSVVYFYLDLEWY